MEKFFFISSSSQSLASLCVFVGCMTYPVFLLTVNPSTEKITYMTIAYISVFAIIAIVCCCREQICVEIDFSSKEVFLTDKKFFVDAGRKKYRFSEIQRCNKEIINESYYLEVVFSDGRELDVLDDKLRSIFVGIVNRNKEKHFENGQIKGVDKSKGSGKAPG